MVLPQWGRLDLAPGRAKLAVAALVGVFIAYWSTEYYSLTKLFARDVPAAAVPDPAESSPPSRRGLSNSALRVVVESAPFGRAIPPVPTQTEYASLPESRLSITVAGTFTHSNRSRASALLSVDGNSAQYFRIGDSVSDTAVLYDVTRDGVVLTTDDGYEAAQFSRLPSQTMITHGPRPHHTKPTSTETASTSAQWNPKPPTRSKHRNELVRLHLQNKLEAFRKQRMDAQAEG